MGKIVLGKVAFTPRGKWQGSKLYERYDMVYAGACIYISLKDENKAALDDTKAWVKFFDDGRITTEKIADEAITNEKLMGESVSWDKLDEDVKNAIASIQAGGVALSDRFGDSELIGISQKTLTQSMRSVSYLLHKIIGVDGRLTLHAEPEELGETSLLNIRFHSDLPVELLTLYVNDKTIATKRDVADYETSHEYTGKGATVKAVAVIFGETFTAEEHIGEAEPEEPTEAVVYIGSVMEGHSWMEMLHDKNVRVLPYKGETVGVDLVVSYAKSEIVALVDKSVSLQKFTMNGYQIPFKDLIHEAYHVYRSMNLYHANTYHIEIK